jgi:hypothetical protein
MGRADAAALDGAETAVEWRKEWRPKRDAKGWKEPVEKMERQKRRWKCVV